MLPRALLSIALAGILLSGCSSEEAAPEAAAPVEATSGDPSPSRPAAAPTPEPLPLYAEGPPRYVHRFESDPPEWGLETETVRLQTNPFNVIWEVSNFAPGTEPTPEQKRAADALVEGSYESAKRHGWFDYETGLRDGYRLLPGDGNHYRKNELLFDDAVLDPDKPEVLMYYNTPGGYQLAGFMYQTSSRFDRGPQAGGPLTLWHYHIWTRRRCVNDVGESPGFIEADETCARGFEPFQRSYEMIHVWLIDRDGGPFSSDMSVNQPQLTEGLAKRKAERGY